MADLRVVALDDLRLDPFHIEGGTADVSMAVLRESDRARTVLVRFPRGWRRPETGSYEASEELVVLEGTLEMTGETYGPGDWAYVPAGARRTRTRATSDVLAVAHFDAPARWRTAFDEGAVVERASLTPGEESCPFGDDARGLRAGSWTVGRPASGRPCESDAEILSVPSRSWAWVPAGAPLASLPGPWFCFCERTRA